MRQCINTALGFAIPEKSLLTKNKVAEFPFAFRSASSPVRVGFARGTVALGTNNKLVFISIVFQKGSPYPFRNSSFNYGFHFSNNIRWSHVSRIKKYYELKIEKKNQTRLHTAYTVTPG